MEKFPKNKVFTTQIFSNFLYNSSESSAKKKVERRLNDWGINYKNSSKNTLVDELGREGKSLVIDDIIMKCKRKRFTLLFLKVERFNANTSVLYANDHRGGRRWIFFDAKREKSKNIEFALNELIKHENKDTVLLPSGELTKSLRKIVNSWQSHEVNIDGKTLRICLEIYSHGLEDKLFFSSRSERIKPQRNLSHLDRLEAESIHIFREVVAEAQNPVMLYSIGKDSSVMVHLALKAFYPSKPPFPLLHVDTRWKFQAMYDFRDYIAQESGIELITHINPEGISKNINPIDHGSTIHTEIMKTKGLKQALDQYGFDVAFGGARRDEESSRAKERIFSFRNAQHHWDPKHQRPEIWNLYNTRKSSEGSIRAFPISNWTELDIWQYIYREKIEIVPLYFSAERPVIQRGNSWIMLDDNRLIVQPHEKIQIKRVRFRTLGCYPLTGAVESDANDIETVISEVHYSETSERNGRSIDTDINSSMEQKKREGYF